MKTGNNALNLALLFTTDSPGALENGATSRVTSASCESTDSVTGSQLV